MENSNTLILVVGLLIGWSIYSTIMKQVRKNRVIKKLELSPVIVDVRTQGEYGTGHYDGAINIPVDKLRKSLKRIGKKDAPVIVYCASGSRSRQAKSILTANGFSDVTNAGSYANMP